MNNGRTETVASREELDGGARYRPSRIPAGGRDRDLRELGRRILRKARAAGARRKVASRGNCRTVLLARGGRGGPALPRRAGSLRRPGRRLPPRGRADGGDRPPAGQRVRSRAAQCDRRALHPPLRLRGAEETLAARDGLGRDDRRDRDDRARRRLGPPGRPDHRPARRQSVCDQRPEDLHQQRPARRPRHRRRQDRSGQGRQGNLADRGRDGGRPRLQARAQSRQDRHGGAGHLRALLRRRSRADRRICSARRKAWASCS